MPHIPVSVLLVALFTPRTLQHRTCTVEDLFLFHLFKNRWAQYFEQPDLQHSTWGKDYTIESLGFICKVPV